MTDSTAGPDGFAGILPALPVPDPRDERQRTIRRWLAGGAVVVVHLLGLALIVFSVHVPILQRIRETVPEAIMWIPMAKSEHPPRKLEEQPTESFPILTAPITLLPEPRRALPPPPSGGMEGVGRSLACGASSYENLSTAQREACLRRPWAFVKRPDGTIVLDVPKPAIDQPTAADIMRHEQQTAPPCPLLANVPCLGKVLHGDPLGGSPAPF